MVFKMFFKLKSKRYGINNLLVLIGLISINGISKKFNLSPYVWNLITQVIAQLQIYQNMEFQVKS